MIRTIINLISKTEVLMSMISPEIAVFLDDEGSIKQYPAAAKKKVLVIEYLAGKFEKDRIYTEKEVNAIINQWHTFGDYFLLRRMLIEYGFMGRKPNGSEYWVIKRQEDVLSRGYGMKLSMFALFLFMILALLAACGDDTAYKYNESSDTLKFAQ